MLFDPSFHRRVGISAFQFYREKENLGARPSARFIGMSQSMSKVPRLPNERGLGINLRNSGAV